MPFPLLGSLLIMILVWGATIKEEKEQIAFLEQRLQKLVTQYAALQKANTYKTKSLTKGEETQDGKCN
jgi:Tfp pilus assembly protein PilN